MGLCSLNDQHDGSAVALRGATGAGYSDDWFYLRDREASLAAYRRPPPDPPNWPSVDYDERCRIAHVWNPSEAGKGRPPTWDIITLLAGLVLTDQFGHWVMTDA